MVAQTLLDVVVSAIGALRVDGIRSEDGTLARIGNSTIRGQLDSVTAARTIVVSTKQRSSYSVGTGGRSPVVRCAPARPPAR